MRLPFAILLLLVLALTACGNANTHRVTGSLHLTGDNFTVSGLECQGTGGDSDITMGARVTIRDGGGSILATATLGVGVQTSSSKSCEFEFDAGEVPEKDFYQVEIGGRRPYAVSRGEMERQAWDLQLKLGPAS